MRKILFLLIILMAFGSIGRGQIAYPIAFDTQDTLTGFREKDATYLTAAMDFSQTTMSVAAMTFWSSPAQVYIVQVGTELMKATRTSSTSFTVERGIQGTAATAHPKLAVVKPVFSSYHWDNASLALFELQYRVGIGTSAVSGASAGNVLCKTAVALETAWLSPADCGIGLKIGTTPITFGTNGRVLFQSGGVVQQSAGLTYDSDKLSVIGSTDTVHTLIKGHSTQTSNLLEIQKSSTTDPIMAVTNTGSAYFRSRVSGNDGRIELDVSNANPELKLYGDNTNGYFPHISFFQPGGGQSGDISGYGGLLFTAYAGYSTTASSSYNNAVPFTVRNAYLGTSSVSTYRVTGAQGISALEIFQDGRIEQIGTGASYNRPLPVPALGSATAGGIGGTLATNTYYYKITACNHVGETIGSNEVSVAVTLGQNVTLSWTGVAGADHFRIYRSTTAGSYPGSSRVDGGLYTTGTGAPYYVTSFVDTGYAAAAGTPPTTITHDIMTYRRWAGGTGKFLDFEDESGASVAGIEYTGFGRFAGGAFRLTSGAQITAEYDGSNYLATTVGSTGSATINAVGSGAKIDFSDVVALKYGSDVASASSITITGNMFHVSGTTNIQTISGTGVTAGTCITIIFDGALTMEDDTDNLRLADDFVTTAQDVWRGCYDGSKWYESSRSVN